VGESGAHYVQHYIAGGVPIGVIDPFEPIEVEVDDSQRRTLGGTLCQRTFKAFTKVSTVRQRRQFVVHGKMPAALLASLNVVQVLLHLRDNDP
jgi:hypothetical protein